jgi:PIN domain nuclease of toxin-antitoxin system
VNLLLDTHVLLWAATAPDLLSELAREAISDPENDARVSPVSAWEISIKQSLGTLDLVRPAERWLPDVLRRTGLEVVNVTMDDALRVRGLPWHHRDPFDRLLVAQALERGYAIVTRDPVFASYGVTVVAA